jgi:hypothetical protein
MEFAQFDSCTVLRPKTMTVTTDSTNHDGLPLSFFYRLFSYERNADAHGIDGDDDFSFSFAVMLRCIWHSFVVVFYLHTLSAENIWDGRLVIHGFPLRLRWYSQIPCAVSSGSRGPKYAEGC